MLAPFSLENITSIHIISQRLNVVLGTLTGKKKNIILLVNCDLPFGRSAQICHSCCCCQTACN